MKAASVLGPIVTVLFVACASTVPPELIDARTAYDQASKGPAMQYAPADVHVAQESLAKAEQSFADHGDSFETKDLAYAATRRAELAEARARVLAANQEQAEAEQKFAAMKTQQLNLTSAQLSSATQQLAVQGQQLATEGQALASEKRGREEAEKRAAQAASDLARIASVKQEARGMVITLSGSVLFASAKSDLLPAAQARLSEVADALTKQDPDSKMRIEGYTDSQGSLSFNQDLSQRRAEAVRSYLVSHGIASDRVTAEGFGPAKPVAENSSAEGRANNRRVEIVVERGSKSLQP